LLGSSSSAGGGGLPPASHQRISFCEVEAYVEGNMGVVVLWKSGEVFSLRENT